MYDFKTLREKFGNETRANNIFHLIIWSRIAMTTLRICDSSSSSIIMRRHHAGSCKLKTCRATTVNNCYGLMIANVWKCRKKKKNALQRHPLAILTTVHRMWVQKSSNNKAKHNMGNLFASMAYAAGSPDNCTNSKPTVLGRHNY